MKNLLSLSILSLVMTGLQAQINGVIHFEEIVQLRIHTEDVEAGQDRILMDMPKEMKMRRVLYFNSDESIYLPDDSSTKENSVTMNEGEESRPMIVMKMDEPEEKVYCDLKNHKKLEQRDLFGRLFLVESDLKDQQWKLSGNSKKILGYNCLEAILQDSALNAVAWFCPEIPVSSGPNSFANLPGMILECIRDEGMHVISATRIEMKEFDKSVIVKPEKGKRITKSEFRKLAEEKRKEMQESEGGDGNVIIKIRK